MSERIEYTAYEEAVTIVAERRSDAGLVASVKEYIGGSWPDDRLVTGDKPPIVNFDYVAQATAGEVQFSREVIAAGGEPYWAMYDDEVRRDNPAKRQIVQPSIVIPGGLADMNIARSGQPGGMMSRETVFGPTIAEYYQMLRREVFAAKNLGAVLGNTFDIGPWYKQQAELAGDGASMARRYIWGRMAFGVLCGSAVYYTDEHYKSGWIPEVVLPAVRQVKRDLGVAPLFVERPRANGYSTTWLTDIPDAKERVVVVKSGGRKNFKYGVQEIKPQTVRPA